MDAWLERHRASIFVILVNIALWGMTVVFLRRPDPPPLEIITPAVTPGATVAAAAIPTAPPTETPRPLRVYVSGAIRTPDVYTLPPGSIIKDAIARAGGPLADADLARINLAQELQDQQQIYVPLQDEATPLPPVSGGPALSISAAAASSPTASVVNINTASPEELDTLPGVGPAIAQRIIDYRQTNGPFATIEQIMEVRGIGEATFAKLKDRITVAP